ncbi:MAG: hypothetical protein PHZ07_04505 [Patescibacteria group bacterium]|nr:hypothetical protein [Patescibacteria group bacterium]MDD4304009.1 hypothetical protein [Patescibacteria group bacterium]MDD4695002.1 hypothetical protein [Patescibacteria group bacterium]
MHKESKILREFSKENFQDERDDSAKKIREYRSKHFNAIRQKDEKIQSFSNIEGAISENEGVILELLKQLDELGNEIDNFSNTFLKKILNHQKVKNLQAELVLGQKSLEDLQKEISELKEEKKVKDSELMEIYLLSDLKGAEIISKNFHARELEKWKNSEYDFETLEKYFNEDNLKKLSIDDYVILLQRFPSNMVTHVTRQGIRDHTGHMFHMAGVGEYSEGFMEILKDGRLRSPLGVYLSQENKKQAIENFLHLNLYSSKEKALEDLNTRLDTRSMEAAGSYSDSSAIHFATEEVADVYYGSEKFNEMFICFPSALIASQYYYNGNIISGGGGYWNDAWVWANEEKGIDLESGIVFIPKNAKVDKKTGSRYELDENQNPIVNENNIEMLKKIILVDDFEIDSINKEFEEYNKYDNCIKESFESFLQKNKDKIRKMLNMEDECLLNAFARDPYILKRIKETHNIYLNYNNNAYDNYETRMNSEIRKILEENGLYYKHATDTINSCDFWENYFKESRIKKPNKIVYYEESDPSLALYNFRKKNGLNHSLIRNRGNNNDMLSSREISRKDNIVISNIDHFKELAFEVVDEYFDRKV